KAEDGIRVWSVTGVQTCALPISATARTAISNGTAIVAPRLASVVTIAVPLLIAVLAVAAARRLQSFDTSFALLTAIGVVLNPVEVGRASVRESVGSCEVGRCMDR